MSKRTSILLLVMILLGAAVLRVGLRRETLYYPDSCVYLAMAENLKRGDFSHSIFPEAALHQPLYPLCTAVLSLVGFSVQAAGMTVSILAGVGLVLALFFLGRRLAGDGAGFAAALLAAADPVLVTYSTELLTESLFLCLFYLAVLLILRAGESSRPWLAAGCGALAAAAFGARFIGVAALPAACGWLALLRFRSAPGAARRRLVRATAAGLLVLLGFVLAASPVLLRNRVVRGHWSITGFVETTEAGMTATGKGREAADGGGGALSGMLERYSGMRAGNAVDLSLGGYLAEFWRVFRDTVPWVWPLLALAGVAALVTLRGLPGLFPAAYLGGWLLLPMGITFLARSASGSDEISRYLAPVLPALLLLAAIGLAAPAQWILCRFRRRDDFRAARRVAGWAVPAVVALVLALGLGWGPLAALAQERATQAQSTSWSTGARDTAAFIRQWADEQGVQKPVVMDRKPFAAYYAGAWWVPLRDRQPRHLLESCYRAKSDLVVVDSAAVALSLPRLARMVVGEWIPSGFRLVYHRVYQDQERIVAVYQVLRSKEEGREGMQRRDGLAVFAETTAVEHALTGRRLYAEGQVHLAGLHLQRAVELRPGFAEAWYQLGAVYFLKSLFLLPERRHLGAFHKAIRCYAEAARLSPRLAPMVRRELATLERNLPPEQLSIVFSRLGRLYGSLGRENEARSAYRRALAVDSHNRAARAGLEALGPRDPWRPPVKPDIL